MRRLPERQVRPAFAAPALLAVALVVGCSAGTSSDASSSPFAAAPSSSLPVAGTSGGPAPTTPSSAVPAVQHLTLTVSGDSVTGDTGTVPVQLGQPVELTVTSDVADEVHVHGADVGKAVPAGGTVVLDFVQNAPGRFEVELEKRKRVLTRLQVS